MRLITLIAALTFAFASAAFANDCRVIVSETVAEIQAGEQQWDERTESLVRRAAGAACVKTMTEQTTVPTSMTGSDAAQTVTEMQTDVEVLQADEEIIDDGKAGWKFLGFDVNKVDGSPSQKSYRGKR